MGSLFGILIWTSLLVSVNSQALFDNMGKRQRSADLALHFVRTELQQFSQSIERMVMKKLEEVKNVIDTKISNLIETKNTESLSQIQTEQRLLSKKIESLTTNLSGKIEKISDLITTSQTEQRLLKQGIVSLTSKADTLLNKSETNCVLKSENALEDIKNASLYVAEQLSSGEVIDVLRYLEMISRLNNIAGTDCADILENYPDARGSDGVHTIMVSSNKAKVVYCDMTTDNGGWTVIQRRVNGSVDFYRNWTEYKNGFGFADHEYWIGNDMLHRLTSLKSQELRVDMERFNGEKAYAVYSSFSVGDEASKYKLQVNGYSGNAGDSLTKKGNNMMFTTLDQDNDERSGWNCAIKWRTAGWFKDGFQANPNGQYTDSEKKGWKYILWYYWKKSEISLKTIQLMIRPRV